MAFFPSLKQNVIAYRFSKVSDCIFEIYELRQTGFSSSFEPEIIRIGQSSHKMYINKILNFQEVYDNSKYLYEKSLETSYAPRICIHTSLSLSIHIYICACIFSLNFRLRTCQA